MNTTDTRLGLICEAAEIMRIDGTEAKLLALGQYHLTCTPEGFTRHIATKTTHWRQVIKGAHIEKAGRL